MARRKKLNKRLVILLVALGVVVVAGGVTVFLKRLPKDPGALAAQAEAALAKKKYADAAKALGQAIEATRDSDPSPYMYQLAKVKIEWAQAKQTIVGDAQAQRMMSRPQRHPYHL